MICVPIAAPTTEEALKQMERFAPSAECIELRLDFIESPDLAALLAVKDRPVLITNRRRDEGGRFSGTEEERIDLLAETVRWHPDYLDLELSTGHTGIAELQRTIRRHGGRTVLMVSYHDFEQTPSEEVLRSIVDNAVDYDVDMVKLATLARDTGDNLRILDTIGYGRKRGVATTALCMGEKGKISRVMAPFFGSFFCYAAGERGVETAPGQLTVDEMKSILRIVTP